MAKRLILGFVCALAAVGLHAATFTVTNINDLGAGSLRQAITDANGNGSAVTDVIDFNIAAAGVQTIAPASALPSITTPVTIDGYTQSGASANSAASGTNAVLLISIDCVAKGFVGLNFTSTASASTVRGLNIQRCSSAIRSIQATNLIITGNFIGTDAGGTIDRGNGTGIDLLGANNSTIGGAAASASNLISGNDLFGIMFATLSGTTIRRNIIGTERTGNSALANVTGILIRASSGNTVDANVISGNGGTLDSAGIAFEGDCKNNVVTSNLIGLNAAGNAGIGNVYGITMREWGSLAPVGNTIGTQAGPNVIGYSTSDGISLFDIAAEPNAQHIAIRYNEFRNNARGIDLSNDGLTANDEGAFDGDVGPNALQNFPFLYALTQAPAGQVHLGVQFSSAISQSYDIDLYTAAQCNGTGFGEGHWLAEAHVSTDATGVISFFVLTPPVPPGSVLSATATDSFGNTSEFGVCSLIGASPAPPTVSINDMATAEGNAGTHPLIFNVTLSATSVFPVSVGVTTSNGSAQAGSDYTATSQTLTFAPGETFKQVLVPIAGDLTAEQPETFTVTLSNAVNTTIADGSGTGTINNDDVEVEAPPAAAPVPALDHVGLIAVAALLIGLALFKLR